MVILVMGKDVVKQDAGEVCMRCCGDSTSILSLSFQTDQISDVFSSYTGQAFTTGSQSSVSSGLSFSQAKSQNFDPFADLANLGSGLPGEILLFLDCT